MAPSPRLIVSVLAPFSASYSADILPCLFAPVCCCRSDRLGKCSETNGYVELQAFGSAVPELTIGGFTLSIKKIDTYV